jgi:PAS domain-containing protein
MDDTTGSMKDTGPGTNGHPFHIEEDIRIKDYAIASSINGIAIGDLNGIVSYVNNAALRMWGTEDPSEIIGKPATVFRAVRAGGGADHADGPGEGRMVRRDQRLEKGRLPHHGAPLRQPGP